VSSFRELLTGEWPMMPSERAALLGVLAALRPSLSVEIGTYRGGSLDSISAYSDAVHAFDLRRHEDVTPERFPDVTFHIGDSHELLPRVLEQLAAAGTNVDFALVDGDHSATGVRQDVEDLLSSPCAARTVVLLHDTLNERVRAGLEQVDYAAFGTVSFVDLDFVAGRVMRHGPQADELWYGLGLVVTGWDFERDEWPEAYGAPEVYDAFAATRAAGDESRRPGYGQLLELEHELEVQKELRRLMERSLSWRVTAPLRGARGLLRRARPSR
jgi:hypothetical protein